VTSPSHEEAVPHVLLKNFPGRAQLAADLAPWASGLQHTELQYYWLASCALVRPA
jgi:hypothetical protein